VVTEEILAIHVFLLPSLPSQAAQRLVKRTRTSQCVFGIVVDRPTWRSLLTNQRGGTTHCGWRILHPVVHSAA